MRVVGLVSGGKDSCYGMMQCVAAGHSLVALANLQPDIDGEMDSYMYQSVGHEGVEVLAEAMGLPLFRQVTKGRTKQTSKEYTPEEGDEVEDLYLLLQTIKDEVGVDGVSVGAILSDYQRVRVENVCSRLGLVCLAFLWQRDQAELLAEMVASGVQAILVKVAALGLDPAQHLGRDISDVAPHLMRMKEKWGLNVCGEGGEYETFTLDCPLFNKAIVVDDYQTVIHDDNAVAPVGYLSFKKMRLIEKTPEFMLMPMPERIAASRVRSPKEFLNGVEETLLVKENRDEFDEEKKSEAEVEETEVVDEVPVPILYEEKLCNHPQIQCNSEGWCWVTGVPGEGSSCADAMSNALDKLQELLESRKMSLSDVVGVALWLRDLSQFGAVNDKFSARMVSSGGEPPVRACLEVGLPENFPVLLEATAHKTPQQESSEEPELPKQALHVQSLSHWAPASIGPYSQAVRVDSVVQVAGQIALDPSSGQLLQGAGVQAQCLLAIRHVSRILAAMNSRFELQDVVQGVCYLTSRHAVQTVRQLWERRTTNAIVDFVIVPALPRGALLEWSVWAHAHNRRFEYEETGCRLTDEGDEFANPPQANIRSRWSYDGTVAAMVCYVEGHQTLDSLTQAVDYAMGKLLREAPPSSALTVRAFYRTGAVDAEILSEAISRVQSGLREKRIALGATLVPVLSLHDENTVLSLCGLRFQ
ncbi:uncharacterized protein LOC132200428 [Neocloeon triangulifer]|uniref:uncharacterized protein LOC132200428 n=1 Tax=Neocloeon triangulifer TaxID=2078957 RepID=UPI00286F59B2|nr:uncharacterized protein LOC132200428 [Neocloeon triangulifer]XP_059481870.1 uncharacterized protein LOC132200428 [Neocloeon triangulifer]XP_059481872.1 uncharacterized protein LOC132200428 [Neocloeon triangulifer]